MSLIVPAAPGRPQLYLFRHGRTEWSASGRHTGRTDIPLTDEGERQAKSLALRLEGLSFDHVLTSPRLRASRTCELAGLGAAMQVEADLAEWDYGDYEGLTSAQIKDRRPGWNVFGDGCPNGETPAEVADRADRLIRRLDAMRGRIALFSHGHFSRVLAARWLGQPVALGRHLVLGEAATNSLGYDPGHPDERVIALWNLPPGD
jgi:probable phosphoglycerate mutase